MANEKKTTTHAPIAIPSGIKPSNKRALEGEIVRREFHSGRPEVIYVTKASGDATNIMRYLRYMGLNVDKDRPFWSDVYQLKVRSADADLARELIDDDVRSGGYAYFERPQRSEQYSISLSICALPIIALIIFAITQTQAPFWVVFVYSLPLCILAILIMVNLLTHLRTETLVRNAAALCTNCRLAVKRADNLCPHCNSKLLDDGAVDWSAT